MSQQEIDSEHQATANIPHLIINKLTVALYIYSSDGILLCQLEPSGSPVQVVDFRQILGSTPATFMRSDKAIGHIPIDCTAAQAGHKFEQYLLPVIAPDFREVRNFALTGSLQNLPAPRPPDIVYQPLWYVVNQDAARLASKQGRTDVLTWDPSTVVFDEGHGRGIRRLVQW